jgi:hypothetical protein
MESQEEVQPERGNEDYDKQEESRQEETYHDDEEDEEFGEYESGFRVSKDNNNDTITPEECLGA